MIVGGRRVAAPSSPATASRRRAVRRRALRRGRITAGLATHFAWISSGGRHDHWRAAIAAARRKKHGGGGEEREEEEAQAASEPAAKKDLVQLQQNATRGRYAQAADATSCAPVAEGVLARHRRAALIAGPLAARRSGAGGRTALRIRKVDVPIDAGKRRLALLVFAAAHSIVNGLKLYEANKLAIAVVASAARVVADEAAEMTLQDGVGEVRWKLRQEQASGWRVLRRHLHGAASIFLAQTQSPVCRGAESLVHLPVAVSSPLCNNAWPRTDATGSRTLPRPLTHRLPESVPQVQVLQVCLLAPAAATTRGDVPPAAVRFDCVLRTGRMRRWLRVRLLHVYDPARSPGGGPPEPIYTCTGPYVEDRTAPRRVVVTCEAR